jgi:hypothetical protein
MLFSSIRARPPRGPTARTYRGMALGLCGALASPAACQSNGSPSNAAASNRNASSAGGSGVDGSIAGSAADASRSGGDGGNSLAGCTGALVCDDFETYRSGVAPPAPWVVSKTAGAVTVDTTRAFTGSQSIKVSAPASTGYQSVMLRFTGHGLPTATNVIYGRMMFWLDSSPMTQVHWTFIDGEGLVSGMSYHAVERYGGQDPLTDSDGGFLGSELMASYDTPDSYNGVGPSSDCYQHSQGEVVPLSTWTCAEWEFDGPDNTMRFLMNGQPLDDLTVAGSGEGCTSQPSGYVWTAPQFAQIDLGWEAYQADDARNLWIDDVAIGAERIGCLPAEAGVSESADGSP